MPRGLVRSARGFPQRQRRKTAWDLGPGDTSETLFNATQSLFLGQGFQIIAEGLTLIRIRGQFSMNIETAAAIGERMIGAFGIAIVTDQAFAAGISAVPTPIDEQLHDSWLFWRAIQLQAINVTETFGNAGSGRVEFEVDTKAMRKLTPNDTIYAVVQVVENGTVTANAFFDSRALFKLP